MDYDAYVARCGQLAQSFEAGDYTTAESGWRDLMGAHELPEIDRIIMMHNLAVTVARLGRDGEAEALFDQAIAWESSMMRDTARVGKAQWLAGSGREAEAAELFQALAAEPWASWGERRDYSARAAQLSSGE